VLLLVRFCKAVQPLQRRFEVVRTLRAGNSRRLCCKRGFVGVFFVRLLRLGLRRQLFLCGIGKLLKKVPQLLC
jgi:hypothetical protein